VIRGIASDIRVYPDLHGLPPNVLAGLEHLANNAAGLLVLVSGIGIAVSLIGWVFAAFSSNAQLAERSKSSLGISIAAVALLYLGIAAANYAGRLFS
jgi:DNA topoisomerase VI subunit B